MVRYVIEIPVEVIDELLAPERAVAELEHMAWRQLRGYSCVSSFGDPKARPVPPDYSE
jgi:hypothetical protein